MRRVLPVFIAIVVLAIPANLIAQDGFLFRQPIITFGLQVGQVLPRAQDGVFDLFTDTLTLDRGDFAAPSIGAEVGVRVNSRLDVVLGVFHAQSSQSSEFRNWVDNDDQPIEQVTTFQRTPVTFSARFYPIERGRAVGRYAWVPRAVLPYVGAGAGIVSYKLVQEGDFVDHNTFEVFHDRLHSNGVGPTAHVLAGAQWWAKGRFGLNGEARYSWASASLKDAFSEFDSIDLKGFQWTAGVTARF